MMALRCIDVIGKRSSRALTLFIIIVSELFVFKA